MKKVFVLFVMLLGFLVLSSNKDKPVTKEECVNKEAFQIYGDKIDAIYQNAELSTQKLTDGRVINDKWVLLTPELVKLAELQQEAYDKYLEDSKGSELIIEMRPRQVCWRCCCPMCGWCGNMYPCGGIMGNPCGGWQCGDCGFYPLYTWTVSCGGGWCND
jgi:hypothetical protein